MPRRQLAAAKLTPRLSSPRPVPRTQLVDQMHAAGSAGLVLVHGPAGFGKTTVLLQYYAQLQQRGVRTGWVTLDRADNDLGRVLRYLVEAIRAIDPQAAAAIDRRRNRPPPSLGNAIVAPADDEELPIDLAGPLADVPGRFVLFLDDFEHIESPAILGMLRQFVEYLPAHGQLVVASRTMPELGLGRLRVHGRLLEIQASALRFSSQETASFLRDQRGLALRDEHIVRLQQRTEGWPAALWLVSLALSDRADPAAFIDTFDGTHASITDYLVEDVLSRLPGRLRDFLLRTSVLEVLSAPLCDAVLDGEGSRELIQQIERAHLFLAAQDTDQRWYRFHPLFREALRAEVLRAAPAELPALHRRAAAWWLAQGHAGRAIEHALQCDDEQHALRMLSEHAAETLWQGRARTMARWFGPSRIARHAPQYPTLALAFGWALTLTRRYDECLKLLDSLQAALPPGDKPGQLLLAQEARAQRAFIMAMTDRVKEATALWQDCLPITPASRPFSSAMLESSYGYCLVAESRFDEARRFLEQARRRVQELGPSFIAPMALCLEGAIDFAQGRLQAATARFRAALRGAATDDMPQAAGSTVAAAFLAEALYERGEFDEAEKLLGIYLPALRDVAAPDQLIGSYAVLARIAFARGHADRAGALLDEMEIAGHQRTLPRMVASARLERARIALLQGRLAEAQELIDSASERLTWAPFDGLVTHANDVEAPFIALARLRILEGQGQATIAPLKQALREARGLQRQRRALKLEILLAEALCATGQVQAGLRQLRDALRYAATEGFLRCCADEGPTLGRWVAELRAGLGTPAPHDSATDALRGLLDRLLATPGFGPADAPPAAAGRPSALAADAPVRTGCALSSPLSEREHQVLQLLAGGHRNRDIADRLFVSETTVKAHLRNINVKLDAQSRTHAVALARQMGLVD